MVPEDESALIARLAQRGRQLQPLEGVRILHEQRVAVQVAPSDPGGRHHQGAKLPARQAGDLIGPRNVLADVALLRVIVAVAGDGDRLQPVLPGLLNPRRRPHVAVRIDRVHVKIALKGAIALNIGNRRRIAGLRSARAPNQQSRSQKRGGKIGAFCHIHLLNLGIRPVVAQSGPRRTAPSQPLRAADRGYPRAGANRDAAG